MNGIQSRNHFQQWVKGEVKVFFSSLQIQGFQNLSVPFFNFLFLHFFFHFFFSTFQITVINKRICKILNETKVKIGWDCWNWWRSELKGTFYTRSDEWYISSAHPPFTIIMNDFECWQNTSLEGVFTYASAFVQSSFVEPAWSDFFAHFFSSA